MVPSIAQFFKSFGANEREFYHEQMDKQIHINPILSEIYDEIHEDERDIYMIENDSSSEYSYHGDDDY